MRSLTDLLSRANTPVDSNEAALVPAEVPTHFKSSPFSFMEIAERVGSDNEALRNLLLDIDLQFDAIENLKTAFAKVVEPLHNLAETLSETKLESAGLRASLKDLRASHDALSAQHQALDKNALLLSGDNHRLSQDLISSDQARKVLEGDNAAQTEQIATLCANLTSVETELRERATEARELADEKRMLSEH